MAASMQYSANADGANDGGSWSPFLVAIRHIALRGLAHDGVPRAESEDELARIVLDQEKLASIIQQMPGCFLYRDRTWVLRPSSMAIDVCEPGEIVRRERSRRAKRRKLDRFELALGKAHFELIAALQRGDMKSRATRKVSRGADVVMGSQPELVPAEVWVEKRRVRQPQGNKIPGPVPNYAQGWNGSFVSDNAAVDLLNIEVLEENVDSSCLKPWPTIGLVEAKITIFGTSKRFSLIEINGEVWRLRMTKGLAAIICLIERRAEGLMPWVRLDALLRTNANNGDSEEARRINSAIRQSLYHSIASELRKFGGLFPTLYEHFGLLEVGMRRAFRTDSRGGILYCPQGFKINWTISYDGRD